MQPVSAATTNIFQSSKRTLDVCVTLCAIQNSSQRSLVPNTKFPFTFPACSQNRNELFSKVPVWYGYHPLHRLTPELMLLID